MPSYFTVVQYVPDPIADERINIGVIAYDDEGRIRSRFLSIWRRVNHFGGGADIHFLRQFESIILEASSAQRLLAFHGRPAIDRDAVERMSGSWINSIQFTPPRASTRDVDSLIREVGTRFLREGRVKRPQGRDRRQAGALTVVTVKEAIDERGGRDAVRDYFRRNWDVFGDADSHKFDVVVKNGAPFFAANGISFEVGQPRELEKDVAAVAWAFDDVRQRLPELPLALVALPPREPDFEPYLRARKVTKHLGVELVLPDNLDRWARQMAMLLPAGHSGING